MCSLRPCPLSSQEQKLHGLSVDNQIRQLKRFCKENGYTVAGIYNDAGISARKSYKKRPALLQLIDDCQANKIDLIIFTKLDRFFRSVPDYYACIEQMNNVPWRAIEEDYETETSSGIFKVNIMLSVAQSEADRTSERLKSIYAYKKENGDYCGIPPLGYKRENKKLVKDEKTAPFVDAFFKTYIETFSVQKAMSVMSEMGLNISMPTATRMIKRPIYYGTDDYQKCEGYITLEQHEYIEEHRRKTTTRATKNQVYLFSGLIRCPYCGHCFRCSNTKFVQADGSLKIHKYYKCNGKDSLVKHEQMVNVSQAKLEKYLLDSLDAEIYTYNTSVNLSNIPKDEAKKKKQKKSLEDKLERIGIRFELGDISIEEYKEKREAIKNELSSISFEGIRKPINMPDNWKEIYGNLDEEHKKRFWNKIIKEIVVFPKSTEKNPTISFNDFWLYQSDDDLID